MREFFKGIFKDIQTGKNIDVYVAILANGVLAILSFLDVLSFQILGGAILASLSWLTLNALIERKAGKLEMENFFEQIKSSKGARAKEFFSENYVHNSDEFQNDFRSAHDLHVIGMGQARMIVAYGAQIRRILKEGGKVRFILCDPDGEATKMSAKRGSTQQSFERIRNEHFAGIERLTSLKGVNGKGILDVKLVDILMPFTMYGFDVYNASKAKIYVWLTPFQEPSENRPGFVLSIHRDQYWFNYFKNQFEKYWEWDEAKSFDIKT